MLFFTILEADGSPAWQKNQVASPPPYISVNDQHRQYLNPGLFCDSAPVLFPPAPSCLPTVNQAQKQRKLLQSTFPKRRALATRFVHYVADMTVAWHDKVAHKRVRAGPPSRRTGPLSMVSAEYLTRPTLDPIPDSLQDVVSIGSLWNKLIQPQGLFGNKATDNSAALILLSLPSSPIPLHLTGKKNKDVCGSQMSQVSEELACLREFLRRGKERCTWPLFLAPLFLPPGCPAAHTPAPLLDSKREVSTKSLREVVKQARGLRTDCHLCSVCLRSPWPSPAGLFSFFGEESCQLTLEGICSH